MSKRFHDAALPLIPDRLYALEDRGHLEGKVRHDDRLIGDDFLDTEKNGDPITINKEEIVEVG